MAPAPAPSTYYVFTCPKHGIFTSLHETVTPPCCDPDHLFGHDYEPEVPSCGHCTLLSDNHFMFLALTPNTLPWTSSMMGIPKLSHSNTWIKCSKHSYWGLQQSFQNDWQTLEGNLYAICNWLALHNTLALDAEPCPLPCLYRYLKLHETCELAEQPIQSSLNGFMVLAGYCSFLLIHCHFIHPTDLRYLWELDLIKPPTQLNAIDCPKLQPLILEIIQTIKDSELVDFTIPCAGVIASFFETSKYLSTTIYRSTSSGGKITLLSALIHDFILMPIILDMLILRLLYMHTMLLCRHCRAENKKNLSQSIPQALCKNPMRVPGII